MLPRRNLETIGAVGANLRGVPNLGKPLYREKTVYIKTHFFKYFLSICNHDRFLVKSGKEASVFLHKI